MPEHKKSSFCGNDCCVEVLIEADVVFVRDSDGDYVCFDKREWREFIKGVKAGEFDV